MQPLHLIAVQVLMTATTIYAQDTIATIDVYSTPQCSEAAFSGSTTLDVSESNTALTGGNCNYAQVDLSDDFNLDAGEYTIYVDQTTIPDNCNLVLYNGAPKDDQASTGECQEYHAVIGTQKGDCVQTSISKNFGYALCCGTSCTADVSAPPKRAPDERAAAKPAPRDVAAIKRTNPLDNRASPGKGCTWNGSGNSISTYGTQERLGPPVSCPDGNDSCSVTSTATYEYSVSNTMGSSTMAGLNLFDILSAQVTFTQSTTHETSHSFSWSVQANIPPGESGYLTLSPHLECTPKGEFDGGDCKDYPVHQPGQVCFLALVSGNPDGIITFVQDT